VRASPGTLASGLLCALLAALISFLATGTAGAQTSTRSFQMTLWEVPLWEYPDNHDPDPVLGQDTDIRVFYDHPGHPEDQPAGLSIVIRADWNAPLAGRGYDWSRIVAIQFDEPYDLPAKSGPCTASGVAAIHDNLRDRATDLKSLAPWVRLWVNFGSNEIHWVMDPSCTPRLDDNYIDVVSFDDYTKPFNTTVYQWFIDHAPTNSQQLALVPGTYCTSSCNNNLQAYFDYAEAKNLSQDKTKLNCKLSLGARGITGIYDGCRVWAVIGFLAGEDALGGTVYHGELNPTQSTTIQNAWRAQLHKPLRPELVHQLTRKQVIQTLLPTLLGN
jgi:hypothetical protein